MILGLFFNISGGSKQSLSKANQFTLYHYNETTKKIRKGGEILDTKRSYVAEQLLFPSI